MNMKLRRSSRVRSAPKLMSCSRKDCRLKMSMSLTMKKTEVKASQIKIVFLILMKRKMHTMTGSNFGHSRALISKKNWMWSKKISMSTKL